MDISETKEMYLVTIAALLEDGEESPISLSLIAKKLSVKPVSVNEMVRKLSEENLIRYLPYKGVDLLPQGILHAREILRRRRLWEVFLVEKLELSLEVADSLACRLEHVTDPFVEERLDDFLSRPSTSPHGKAIPAAQEIRKPVFATRLSDVQVDAEFEILRLDCEKISRDFLITQGVKAGAHVKILAIGQQASVLLQCGEKIVQIGKDLVKHVYVNSRNLVPLDGSNSVLNYSEKR